VEVGAPAPAEHPVVPLDKVGEGTPGFWREGPDGEVVRRGFGQHVVRLDRIPDNRRPVIRRTCIPLSWPYRSDSLGRSR
jgi:hypothetical protein